MASWTCLNVTPGNSRRRTPVVVVADEDEFVALGVRLEQERSAAGRVVEEPRPRRCRRRRSVVAPFSIASAEFMMPRYGALAMLRNAEFGDVERDDDGELVGRLDAVMPATR